MVAGLPFTCISVSHLQHAAELGGPIAAVVYGPEDGRAAAREALFEKAAPAWLGYAA